MLRVILSFALEWLLAFAELLMVQVFIFPLGLLTLFIAVIIASFLGVGALPLWLIANAFFALLQIVGESSEQAKQNKNTPFL